MSPSQLLQVDIARRPNLRRKDRSSQKSQSWEGYHQEIVNKDLIQALLMDLSDIDLNSQIFDRCLFELKRE